MSLRSDRFRHLVKARPTLPLSRGGMLRERVTEEKIPGALRAHGIAGPQEAEAVILETDGSLTALPTRKDAEYVAMRNVGGAARKP